MALTIVLTTSGQKPSRASFISDGFEAGGEEEERLISNLCRLVLKHKNLLVGQGILYQHG